jgi:hypothetical protein
MLGYQLLHQIGKFLKGVLTVKRDWHSLIDHVSCLPASTAIILSRHGVEDAVLHRLGLRC